MVSAEKFTHVFRVFHSQRCDISRDEGLYENETPPVDGGPQDSKRQCAVILHDRIRRKRFLFDFKNDGGRVEKDDSLCFALRTPIDYPIIRTNLLWQPETRTAEAIRHRLDKLTL